VSSLHWPLFANTIPNPKAQNAPTISQIVITFYLLLTGWSDILCTQTSGASHQQATDYYWTDLYLMASLVLRVLVAKYHKGQSDQKRYDQVRFSDYLVDGIGQNITGQKQQFHISFPFLPIFPTSEVSAQKTELQLAYG
jgi:hypothetical protein